MKKIFIIPFLFCLFACSDNPSTTHIYTPPEELYLRDDADRTLIPLINLYKWSYRINTGSEEKPEKPVGQIRNLLDDDAIEFVRILPVRQYDDNEGWGRYEYQALCYITKLNKAFFYIYDKIYVGRYLQTDNNGFESVIWDYELPTYSTEHSSRYFVLHRNVSSPNQNEDFLHEKPGYHTINIQINSTDYREHTECKLFEFQSKRSNPSDPIRINRFYFKQGKGLIRYQQFAISPTDSTEIKLYEQDLKEE